MTKYALMMVTALTLSAPAFAQDASKEPPPVATETTTTIQTPAANVGVGATATVPTQTTVVVPAARDAITGEVVTTTTVKQEEDVSLRDKVRAKLEKK